MSATKTTNATNLKSPANLEAFRHTAADTMELVGNTPIVHLGRISPENGAAILQNWNFLNPGGSIKDRAALGLILDAEQRGVLHPGGTVVEATAGNTGSAWRSSAFVAATRFLSLCRKVLQKKNAF